jgi:hypothetical protein
LRCFRSAFASASFSTTATPLSDVATMTTVADRSEL